jgi:tetratricopeptide (TPR) repeat protein
LGFWFSAFGFCQKPKTKNQKPIISMKKITVLVFSILISAGCGTPPEQAVNSPAKNVNHNSLTVSSRSQNSLANNPANSANSISTSAPKSGAKTNWTQSGEPIDTKEFDAEIAKAEKNLKAKPSDETAKKALAEGYFKRGFALTEARQYASALGDYRRVLKLDPNNEEAKTWINQIIEIYDGLNKNYPKEGEEPPALPFKKS